jgi:hypothetical protein
MKVQNFLGPWNLWLYVCQYIYLLRVFVSLLRASWCEWIRIDAVGGCLAVAIGLLDSLQSS